MPIQKLFPTYFYRSRMPAARFRTLNKRLEKECYTFSNLDVGGKSWSQKNYLEGYTSYSSLADLPERSPTFHELKSWIDREAQKFISALQWDVKKGDIQMSTCWINIMGYACHHSFHLHPRSVISGTYYVKAPKDSGSFKVEDPRVMSFMGSPMAKGAGSKDHRRYHDFEPKPGDLVLFESWLKHEVPANRAKSDRISVSFNYDWRET